MLAGLKLAADASFSLSVHRGNKQQRWVTVVESHPVPAWRLLTVTRASKSDPSFLARDVGVGAGGR